MNWYLGALKKYAIFYGRARRKEYWMFVLISMVAYLVLGFVDAQTGTMGISGVGLLSGLYWLGTIIPAIAVTVRRLHDTNHSGWWYFIVLVPIAGPIILLVFLVRDGQPEANAYGPNPKADAIPVT